ncbi:MAG: LuxR C-terminal-related transcriptional regulator [Peptococcaceae bacterium]|nr:LuxR C-terminal-related transcriptional regulator [Peptococcaceae bacterium]
MNNSSRLNGIFISQRLKRRLSEINDYPLTTVVAPMGFGKTTAVNWWAQRQVKSQADAVILRQVIVSDSITDFWAGFCRAFKGYPVLTEQMKALGYPRDATAVSMLAELLDEALAQSSSPIYMVMDDLHILLQKPLIPLLLFLSRRLPECFHIVLVSRNQIFNGEERMRLGHLLGEITVDDLRLSRQELAVYARFCRLEISAREIDDLAALSEGWISMVYLNFKAYARNGSWLSSSADIFTLIDQVLLDPLPERLREFLIRIGMTDEFTAEQAAWLWRLPDAAAILESLSKNNAFITRNENGIYRYHHMLRQCARHKFVEKPAAYQQENYSRLGQWYLDHAEYVPAYYAFAAARDWNGLLKTLEKDKAKSLNTEHSQDFFHWVESCPEEYLLRYPTAIVASMVKMFSFHNIPEIKRMKGLLLKSLDRDTALTQQERHDLLGDAEVSESFLCYNNISAMSTHHRRACALLSRTSLSVDPKGAWTFSAPAIFMMYHRSVGGADSENAEMKECMPYYYQVSDGHGSGAEHGFAADLFYERGQLNDADIANRMALSAARRKNQFSVMLTCDFLFMRMALFHGDFTAVKKRGLDCQEWLRRERQYTLLNTLDMCRGFLYALLGHPEAAPGWLSEGRLQEALVLFPATPMLHTFYNQLLLARGEWTAVAARRWECEKLYGVYHNVLCQIWLHIQLSAALERIGRHEEALTELHIALDMALPDGIVMPFAENEVYLTALLRQLQEQGVHSGEIGRILSLSDGFRGAKQKILWEHWSEHENYGLSQRELEIARLAARRKTNPEIARELHLAEGTVRNQLSRIFYKLGLTGDGKNKRLELEALLKLKK